MQDWIPIEVLPKRKLYEGEVQVLCFLIVKGEPMQRVLTYEFWCNEFKEENINESVNELHEYNHCITHWQPLPKNPQ